MTRTNLPPPVNGFLDAINRNDTAEFLAYFPHDGVVDDWGTRYIGHARIKDWSGREISLAAEVGGNGFTGPSRFVLVVEGEQVREMRITAH